MLKGFKKCRIGIVSVVGGKVSEDQHIGQELAVF